MQKAPYQLPLLTFESRQSYCTESLERAKMLNDRNPVKLIVIESKLVQAMTATVNLYWGPIKITGTSSIKFEFEP